MINEHQKRLSLIDGSIEHVQPSDGAKPQKKLEPLYEEVVVEIITLEGIEQIKRKRIIGFTERKHE